MKIHPVNHTKGDKNRYCGPSAISIVTGMSTGEAARLIRATSGVKQVQGTYWWQMERALKKCGIVMRPVAVKPQPWKMIRDKIETRPTLAQWYRDTQELRSAGRVFLISAGHHWQIVSGRRFCCGRTGAIVPITDKKAHRRARVDAVYELVATGRITIPEEARKPKPKVNTSRQMLRQLERELGFKGKLQINIGVPDYEVPPCPIFPNGFSTMHHDWEETYGRVLHCTQPEVYASLADNDWHYSG